MYQLHSPFFQRNRAKKKYSRRRVYLFVRLLMHLFICFFFSRLFSFDAQIIMKKVKTQKNILLVDFPNYSNEISHCIVHCIWGVSYDLVRSCARATPFTDCFNVSFSLSLLPVCISVLPHIFITTQSIPSLLFHL